MTRTTWIYCTPRWKISTTISGGCGQPEALTYQRAIRALENYSFDALIPILGWKLFEAIGERCIFVQQYDPFTGIPSAASLEGKQDAYGPAMPSVLEYAVRMYGVHMEGEQIYWGCLGHTESSYGQCWGDQHYRLVNTKAYAEGFLNGRRVTIHSPGSE